MDIKQKALNFSKASRGPDGRLNAVPTEMSINILKTSKKQYHRINTSPKPYFNGPNSYSFKKFAQNSLSQFSISD